MLENDTEIQREARKWAAAHSTREATSGALIAAYVAGARKHRPGPAEWRPLYDVGGLRDGVPVIVRLGNVRMIAEHKSGVWHCGPFGIIHDRDEEASDGRWTYIPQDIERQEK